MQTQNPLISLISRTFFATAFFILASGQILAEEDTLNSQSGSVYQAKKYRDILNLIDSYYYREIDIDSLSEETFKMMLQSLDQYSYFYDKEEYIKQQNTDDGESLSLGFNYLTVDGHAMLYNIFPEGPADIAGMKNGSRLLRIDGRQVHGDSITQLNDLVYGESGDSVEVVFDYFGKQDSLVLVREKFVLPSVNTYFLLEYEEDVPYIAINRFSDNTDLEFSQALDDLMEKSGSAGNDFPAMLIDLRGNLGGKLNAARDLASHFLDSGVVVTRTASRSDAYSIEVKTQKKGDLQNVPLIVLVDEQSASASEIFAGMVQDYDLGVLVGSQTYGKGIVQNTWDFKDSTGIRFTVASYTTPSGREVETKVEYDESSIDESIFFNMSEEQAANLRAQLEKMGTSGKVEVFKTSKGRSVFGLKGIRPDIMEDNNEYTKMHKLLFQKRMYFLAAYLLVNEGIVERESIESDKDAFYKEWQPSPEAMARFQKLAIANSLWNDEMFAKDKDLIVTSIKSEIAHIVFGYGAKEKVLAMESGINDKIDLYLKRSIKIRDGDTDN